jgi:stage V sporulation protein AC
MVIINPIGVIIMNMSDKDYAELVKKKSKNSPIIKNTINAFLIGGAICTIGELILKFVQSFNILSKEDTSSVVSICMIFLGALLTGLKVYDNIAKVAGAGTIVPITGFANSIVSPAMEFKTEGYILGMGAKMFAIAGPVLVFGTTASVIYGVILYIIKLF